MAELILNDAELNELLHGRTGPVFRVVKQFADDVVLDVRTYGPLGYDQGGRRTVGLLREDMRIRSEEFGPEGIVLTVGTDPTNPRDGYNYALRIHQGHDAYASMGQVMKFRTRDGRWHSKVAVGPAAPVPFLYDAVERANNGADPVFILNKAP